MLPSKLFCTSMAIWVILRVSNNFSIISYMVNKNILAPILRDSETVMAWSILTRLITCFKHRFFRFTPICMFINPWVCSLFNNEIFSFLGLFKRNFYHYTLPRKPIVSFPKLFCVRNRNTKVWDSIFIPCEYLRTRVWRLGSDKSLFSSSSPVFIPYSKIF
jgi:hypothetical protein